MKLRDSFGSLEKMQSSTEDIEAQINFYIYYKEVEDAVVANEGKLGKKIEVPRLVKKTTALNQILGDSFDISMLAPGSQPQHHPPSNHTRHFSYGSSPLSSAWCLNYNS